MPSAKDVLVAVVGWAHWVMVGIVYGWWVARGSPSGGDVLWYYVMGFGPAWLVAAGGSAWHTFERAKGSPSAGGKTALVVAWIGVASPLVLFMR